MITLSNGHKLEHVTASGAMGYNGRGWPHEQLLACTGLIDVRLFTHKMKTITLPPRKGNFRWFKPWDCVRPIWENGKIVGTVNAYGLTNPGLDWFLGWIKPFIRDTSIPLIASVFSDSEDSAKELGIMASRLGRLPFVAIEFNTSCPNTGHGVMKNVEQIVNGVGAIRKNCDLPVGLKVANGQDVESILREVAGEIQYIDINSVQWSIKFPNRGSPLPKKFGGGGVSGKSAQSLNWSLAEKLKNITTVPVTVPSIWEYDDIGKMRSKGFEIFSYGALCLCYPHCPTLYVRRDRKEIRDN